MTDGEKVIQFIEKYCKVPEGKLVGQPLVLLDFQKRFILDVYNNEAGTQMALLSIARKNGKSALIASLMLAHICGPMAKQNTQIISGAMSRDQAALVFKLACKMIRLSSELSQITRIIPSQKTILGLARDVEYRAISAEASTAHGLSPVLAILDELGQIKGEVSPFVDAILSSQGAHDNPLTIVISTSAPSDGDLFNILCDDAIRSGDEKLVCHVYCADKNSELLDEEQWKKANPALGVFRSRDDLETQLTKAARLPATEATARNLLLNQRVAAESLFMAPSVWKKNSGEPDLDVFRENPVAIGLDLSARNDLTAAVLAARDELGVVHLLPYVFTPSRDIEERARRDRAPYDAWVRDGQMYAIGGASIDYDQVAGFLAAEMNRLGIAPAFVMFDRWRIDMFKAAADRAGFAPFAAWKPVGQGYKDMSPCLEAFMALALESRLRHGGHPLLNLGAANAIATRDPAGSMKLDKAKATQRIDQMVAAVMAVYAVSDGNIAQEFDIGAYIA